MTTIGDIIQPGAGLWAKADFEWRWVGHVVPFTAYGKEHIAAAAAERMSPGDLVLSVRISDSKKAKGKPGLIEGVLEIRPADRRPTSSYLPREVIALVEAENQRAWPFAIGGTRTWETLGEPNAKDVIPVTRSRFSRYSGEKGVSHVVEGERAAVLALQVREVQPTALPGVAALMGADKRRRVLAGRVAPEIFAERRRRGLLPPALPKSEEQYARAGRVEDHQDAMAALGAQDDRCTLCGGLFGRGALAPVQLRVDADAFEVVHAACRAREKHPEGGEYLEGDRVVPLEKVVKGELERSAQVPMVALGENLRRHGRLVCEVCTNDWMAHPGVNPDRVARLFEVHHLVGVAVGGGRETDPLTDVVVVCALCHKLAHAKL